ncbi:hypothetical protein Tco_0314242, partial [Tanacetum coccineum]
PPDVYALMNYHTDAKELWDRVKFLMEGSKLSLQERESTLYNKFDKFTYEKVNTKFVNHLQPEWSKFVTDVKLAKDMYNSNFDQLYAYLRQPIAHANEVQMTRQRFPDPLSLVANSYNSPPVYTCHQS